MSLISRAKKAYIHPNTIFWVDEYFKGRKDTHLKSTFKDNKFQIQLNFYFIIKLRFY